MTSTDRSSPRKPLLLFVFHALVLALLIGLWPTARDGYPDLFRAGARALFAGGDAPEVIVRPGALHGDATTDTFVEAVGEDERTSWRLSFSTLRMGWWPTAVLCALLFATPMSARRRAWALLGAFVWVGTYAAIRLALEVVRAQVELERGGAEATAEGSVLYLRTAAEVLGSNILEITVVLLGWVLLANPQRVLRLGGLARVLGVPGRPGPERPADPSA